MTLSSGETPVQDEEIYEPIIFTELGRDELIHNPVWFVTLSNGSRAFHKAGRHSWLELKAWLKKNPEIFIENMYFQFRDNIVLVASGKSEGFFFSWGAQAWYGCPTQSTAIAGIVRDGFLYRKKYLIPELCLNAEDSFPIDHPDIQKGLIRSGKKVYK